MPHAPSATRIAFELHARHFRGAARAGASAPGRVNLIGEHTDYNGGPVLPAAIARRTVVLAGKARRFEAVSARDGVVDPFDPDAPMRGEWTDYLAGVVRALRRRRAAPPGAGLAISSDLPVGAGLSSSAALCVAAARALAGLAGARLSAAELAEVAYEAEHDEVGVRCGRMDQTISARARPGAALLFDTGSGAVTHVPFGGEIHLFDTGIRHALADGELNRRRKECEDALVMLRERGIIAPHLADLDPDLLPRVATLLPPPHARRVRHVVTETARTRLAAAALRRGEMAEVGRLLVQGHASLREDCESSCPEADLLVQLAVTHGAWGARLTGAGWGGTVIALIPPGKVRRVIAEVGEGFRQVFGRVPTIWSSRAVGGVKSVAVR